MAWSCKTAGDRWFWTKRAKARWSFICQPSYLCRKTGPRTRLMKAWNGETSLWSLCGKSMFMSAPGCPCCGKMPRRRDARQKRSAPGRRLCWLCRCTPSAGWGTIYPMKRPGNLWRLLLRAMERKRIFLQRKRSIWIILIPLKKSRFNLPGSMRICG